LFIFVHAGIMSIGRREMSNVSILHLTKKSGLMQQLNND